MWLLESRHISESEYQQFTIELLRRGYRFSSVSPNTIVHALRQNSWSGSSAEVRIVMESLGNPAATDESIYGVMIGAIRKIWLEAPDQHTREQGTQAVLDGIDRRAGGRMLVRFMRRLSKDVTSDGPKFLYQLDWSLRNWLMTGDVTDFSWKLFGPKQSWLASEIG